MYDEIIKYDISSCPAVRKVIIITSAKEVMFSVALVCLFVCPQDNWKSYERILIKFAGDVRGGQVTSD